VNRELALEKIERRKELRDKLANTQTDDLVAILTYLHRDVMIDLIMKCDVEKIGYALTNKLETE